MREIEIEEAGPRLSELVDEALGGDVVVLRRDGRDVARLVPVKPPQRLKLGLLSGQMNMPSEFNSPLPDDLLDLFEGR